MKVLTATRNAALFLILGSGTALLALPLFWLVVSTALLSLAGIGLPLIPPVTRLVRRLAGWQRRRLAMPAPPYLPLEGPLPIRVRAAVGEPAMPREVLWLLAHGLSGIVLGFLALGLPVAALNAATVPLWWWFTPGSPPSVLGYAIDSWPLALTGPFVAAGYLGVACLILPTAAGLSERLSRSLLKPLGRVGLAQQVALLTAARASALEAHAQELRRIERTLHDGTQNRLVAVVMHLGMLERALADVPESTRRLAGRAQEAASDALVNLRDAIRAIHPPVLTEHGLDGALAALAARSPVPCTVEIADFHRLPAAVEAAAYFTAAEALTNVAKHSHAGKAVVRVYLDGGLLTIEIEDDGVGGARSGTGSGLTGIDHRAAAFGGRTTLTSPPGGPTVLKVELPCGL
ncbi:sensor histidine kinase [Nonomuraea angiospora]|uniref:sensor histidine kinase n=1 Tax=Nonomuraea angiospora TaxID=46172 RepID=UPI0029BBF03F|nr:sensor domain-containing protein [Nonomuraea angiospora]MDX3105523.1 sensor domain-containing protein [Nonomuraea angiospora]